ncbi:MAG TPA: type II toxin-antitoxin system VapC family toxin [Jatrophihabitans sp.]|nr:type II toxin-antitoxin system VapC family toxin [Jatrophihabitans sp.]
MIVVDAGLVVAALVATDADAVRGALRGEELAAPSLLDLEVLSALRGLSRGGQVPESRARAAIEDLADLPIQRHDHLPLLNRCWQLRDNLTAYDAAYVALAELLDLELWTTDLRVARSSGVSCRLRVFSPG